MNYQNLIGGDWTQASSGKTFDDVNPADTRDIVGRFQASTADDARAAVAAASSAFDAWRKTPISKRAKVLQGAAEHLEANAARFAEELTREEGKSIALAKDEILRSAQTLRFYAVEGQSFSGETFPQDDPEMLVYSAREPLGVVSVITPWNFPISIPARKIAPALVTGNTVVFKPSSDAPLIGYRLTEALVQGGLPKGALNFITGTAHEVGALLTESPMSLEPMATLFPARNRLISGLVRAVIVVEAGDKSGALITARHAAEQGREVFAIPGPVDSSASAGTLQLLRQGAKLARHARDVLDDLAGIAPITTPATRFDEPAESPKPAAPAPPPPNLDPLQQSIWDCLNEPRTVDDLCRQVQQPIAHLSGVLMTLELKKCVRRLPGNVYERS